MTAPVVANRALAGMTVLEEIRKRRAAEDDPTDQAGAARDFARESKRRGQAQDRRLRDVYDEGRRQERQRARQASSRRRPTTGRKSSTRRRPPASVRTASRQLAAPVRAQTVSAVRSLGLVLSVVVLYQVLRHAAAVEGALGGASRALEWLSAPDRSIPYAGS